MKFNYKKSSLLCSLESIHKNFNDGKGNSGVPCSFSLSTISTFRGNFPYSADLVCFRGEIHSITDRGSTSINRIFFSNEYLRRLICHLKIVRVIVLGTSTTGLVKSCMLRTMVTKPGLSAVKSKLNYSSIRG